MNDFKISLNDLMVKNEELTQQLLSKDKDLEDLNRIYNKNIKDTEIKFKDMKQENDEIIKKFESQIENLTTDLNKEKEKALYSSKQKCDLEINMKKLNDQIIAIQGEKQDLNHVNSQLLEKIESKELEIKYLEMDIK